jgi:hypothetical protein
MTASSNDSNRSIQPRGLRLLQLECVSSLECLVAILINKSDID